MTTERTRAPASPWPFVGIAGLACALFLYGATAIFAAWWVVVLLLAVWVALLVVACAWWTPYPGRVPWVAVVAVLVWVLTVALLSGAGAR